ncbi:MAG: urate oxidase [Kribbellaceae bacterium]|nr:urate oxidase [Kribbellaceae bacterium]
MAITLGPNQYGKAETRVVRVYRDTARHEIRDLNVSTSLRGDFEAAHITGDQAAVLPTDSQKNTVFSFAAESGIGAIEDFGLLLAEHFIADSAAVSGARIEIDEYAWDRIDVDGRPHDHSFVRRGQEIRTTLVTVDGGGAWVISGLKDLVVAKTTGSEFHGFRKDRYTTLPETDDRILATSLIARWRYDATSVDWDASYTSIRALLLATFADLHSLALQQTLHAMGRAVLEQHPEVAEIRFSAPNRHHFLVDLSPFGVDNPGEVFHAADRPYGLIEATVLRDDGPDPGSAWYAVPGFC